MSLLSGPFWTVKISVKIRVKNWCQKEFLFWVVGHTLAWRWIDTKKITLLDAGIFPASRYPGGCNFQSCMLESFFVRDFYTVINVDRTFYIFCAPELVSTKKARWRQFFTLNLLVRNGSESVSKRGSYKNDSRFHSFTGHLATAKPLLPLLLACKRSHEY